MDFSSGLCTLLLAGTGPARPASFPRNLLAPPPSASAPPPPHLLSWRATRLLPVRIKSSTASPRRVGQPQRRNRNRLASRSHRAPPYQMSPPSVLPVLLLLLLLLLLLERARRLDLVVVVVRKLLRKDPPRKNNANYTHPSFKTRARNRRRWSSSCRARKVSASRRSSGHLSDTSCDKICANRSVLSQS